MSGFACMECGHKFKTVAAAQKASFGDSGCPKCGGSDIDLPPVRPTADTTSAKGASAAIARARGDK